MKNYPVGKKLINVLEHFILYPHCLVSQKIDAQYRTQKQMSVTVWRQEIPHADVMALLWDILA